MFDTKTYLDALTPPTFTHEGRTWEGRFLSVNESLRMMRLLESLGEAASDIEYVQRTYARLVDAIFPPKTRRVLRFWGWREERDTSEPSVWDILSGLPLSVQTAAVRDFTNSLAHALSPDTPLRGALGREDRAKLMEAAEAMLTLAHTSPETDASSASSPPTSSPSDASSDIGAATSG